MDNEWWKKVEEAYHTAGELRGEERSRFLDAACMGDTSMRRQVEVLLRQDENTDSFLNRPAVELAASWNSLAMIPETDSHYRILHRLGVGGMGEVYLAEDTRLHRKVAIKFLLPESIADDRARQRLVREARAAAGLDHPNICSIYEVVEDERRCFIVMQYVEGETLADRIAREPIDVLEVVEIASQIADALGEAHARGIIHRDIKPQNIMITPRGLAKVLDFGLAKSVDADAAVSEAETRKSLTGDGSAAGAGTVPYMSPEQVRCESLDPRTDIFSLATVMYEMLTGHQPFAARTSAETIAAILTQEPASLNRRRKGLPEDLERIVAKALQKDKESRYSSARELLSDLRNHQSGQNVLPLNRARRIRRHSGALVIASVVLIALFAALFFAQRPQPIDSLAVMPFSNAGGDSDAEYLSDGISDSIISSLSNLSGGLKVISLNSVLRYKGRQIDPRAVGNELGVRAVLMGRLVQRGEELTISTELVDVRDNTRIWGEQYNRKLAGFHQLQAEISREISNKLKLRLSGEDQNQLAKSYTKNSEAYQLYLRGRFYWNKFTESGFQKSIEYYQSAVQKDPVYALAYAGLADSYVQLAFDFLKPDSVPKARDYAKKALELDDTLAEAHMSLGEVHLFYDWDWPAAERELKRAIKLNPNYPDAYHFYGHYLEVIGRVDEAIQVTKQGLEIDPNSLLINAELAWAYYFARQYDLSVQQCLKTLDLDPNFGFAREYLGRVYAQQKRYEEATKELIRAGKGSPDNPEVLMELGYAYAAAGKTTEAQSIVRRLEDGVSTTGVDPYFLAPIYFALGDRDQALTQLERAYAKRSGWMPFLKIEPKFDSLHSDPRFADLIRRIGIPQ